MDHADDFAGRSGLQRLPLILSLDVDDRDRALQLTRELHDVVGMIKLGPRLIYRYGSDFVRQVADQVPVFVDCKFFDIPSTMISAVRAAFESGASLCTVHALSGPKALAELAKLEAELNQIRPFKLLAVTILTSQSQKDLATPLDQAPLAQTVSVLARDVRSAGLSGLVCSPHELASLQGLGMFLVTPGIRLPFSDHHDQERVLGPEEALRAGASAIVVGRPILEARHPREAALDFGVELLKGMRR